VSLLEPVDYQQLCARCERRRGQHRFADEACPNTHWRAGNGRSQWLNLTFTVNLTPLLDQYRRQRASEQESRA
jgi:hypothetical protein